MPAQLNPIMFTVTTCRQPPERGLNGLMMYLRLLLVLAVLSGCGGNLASGAVNLPDGGWPAASSAQQVAIKRLLDGGPTTEVARDSLALLRQFYEVRDYQPLWTDGAGLRPAGRALLDRLVRIDAARWSTLASSAGDGGSAVLELRLSAAYAAVAIDPGDPAAPRNAAAALAAAGRAPDLASHLQAALPDLPGFWRLRAAIESYRTIAAKGDSRPVPGGGKLELGAQGPRVTALRQALIASGDLAAAVPLSEQFDDNLAAAVRRFQVRHGLEVDGIAGAETLAALNVPVERRLATMAVNLARILREETRWGERYIAVNIPAATYRLVEDGRTVLARPAVVGRPDWPTPRLDSVIETLEFHPYWTVPTSIAALEIWPKVRRDPSYLRRNHMRIVNGQIRQDPGPGNPLGLVKFIFPNQYSVYLHDTNQPALFEQTRRFRSHGCVRVSGALELARRLLQANADWPDSRIAEALAGSRNIRIAIASPIAIHMIYRTAWVDEAGILQFRDDVYGLDRSALATLRTASSVEACKD